MKKFIITIIIIASLFIVAGIGMIVVSSAFSIWPWKYHFCDEMQKIYYNGKMVQKTIEAPAATLKTIDISMINEIITVSKGEEKVVITYLENSSNTYEIIQTSEKILINEKSKNYFWPFKHWHKYRDNQNTVLIQIPDKMKLNTLNINSVNGAIDIESVKIKNADLNIINGTVKLAGSQIDQVKATNTNGICESTGCTVKNLDFHTINGTVSVNKGDIKKIRLHAVNGKIKATDLPGKAADYNINCTTVHGNIYINGEKVSKGGSYKSATSGNRNIDVETVNGKIEINTINK
jgi:DUF4097 and DUF4098 domain-containing protein YvlB